MSRKLPHVGLGLSDMGQRSMPSQDGLTWATQADRERERQAREALFDSIVSFAETVADGTMAMRAPIRVVAEVGEPVREIEQS